MICAVAAVTYLTIGIVTPSPYVTVLVNRKAVRAAGSNTDYISKVGECRFGYARSLHLGSGKRSLYLLRCIEGCLSGVVRCNLTLVIRTPRVNLTVILKGNGVVSA